jgi:hypothetical protein
MFLDGNMSSPPTMVTPEAKAEVPTKATIRVAILNMFFIVFISFLKVARCLS